MLWRLGWLTVIADVPVQRSFAYLTALDDGQFAIGQDRLAQDRGSQVPSPKYRRAIDQALPDALTGSDPPFIEERDDGQDRQVRRALADVKAQGRDDIGYDDDTPAVESPRLL